MQKTTENVPDEMPGALSRRDVLKTAAAGLMLLLPLASACADAAPEQWTLVGKLADFNRNEPKKVMIADGSVL